MGFPVPQNAPQFSVGGQVYAIGAFEWDTPIGRWYRVGVFVRMNDGSWNLAVGNGTDGTVVDYTNPDDCLNDMKAKGGRVKYLQWLLAKINEVLAKLFKGAVVPPVTEPVTDAEAKAAISAYVLGLRVNNTTPPTAQ